MQLTELTFSEFDGEPRHWELMPASFGNINLIVGKNSSGKTRLLNVIAGLANLINGRRTDLYDNGHYKAKFAASAGELVYELQIEDFKVSFEKFTIDGDAVLDRGATGEGNIKAVELDTTMRFQTPLSQLAVVNRRDSVQHPFFEELHEWAGSVKHYLFGSEFGRNVLTPPSDEDADSTRLEKQPVDPNYIIKIFQQGLEWYGNEFKGSILKDFAALGYECSDVSIMNVSSYLRNNPQLLALSVHESDLDAPTPQIQMSQGMFRALAMAIQLSYTILGNRPACILVDDIGEGLDFERSSKLIRLLIDKAVEHKFQLLMTTNDRFVMNSVPLEYWSILRREASIVRIFNIRNSEKIFKDFEYVGLNNFDFFSSEYFLGGQE